MPENEREEVGECSHPDAALTPVQETGKEGGWGCDSVGLPSLSKEVLTVLMENPQKSLNL